MISWLCLPESEAAEDLRRSLSEELVEMRLMTEQTYDCCICNQSSPSTAERPIGLVTLLQTTSGTFFNKGSGGGGGVLKGWLRGGGGFLRDGSEVSSGGGFLRDGSEVEVGS